MVQVRLSSTTDSAALIARYITDQLADEPHAVSADAAAEMLIDVGILGGPWATAGPLQTENGLPAVYPVRLVASLILLGPLSAGEGPCPVCLERRWRALRPMSERRALEEHSEGQVFGPHPALTPFALDAVWHLLRAMLGQGPSNDAFELRDYLVALNLETLRVVKHRLGRDSLCPACATRQPDTPAAAVIELESRPKRSSNGYRLLSTKAIDIPKSVFANPVCGIIGPQSAADYTHTLTAPVSGRFSIRGTRGEHPIWWSGHANSYRDSTVTGILEGLERYAGLLPRRKDVNVFDSLENLGDEALDPRSCGLYQPDFYRTRLYFTPFTPDLKINWVWGYSLTKARPILVPKQLVYYHDYSRIESIFVQDTSSGCATGSCLEEAVLHGLLELIERDTFLLSWYATLSLPHIDAWSSTNRETLMMLDRIDRLGCDTYLLDMRLDTPIPSVMCFTRRRDEHLGTLVFAAGASLDPEDAIRGALCEVASYLPGFDERVADQEAHLRAIAQDYSKLHVINEHALLYGLPEMALKVAFLFQNPVRRSVAETYQDWLAVRPQNHDLLAAVQFCIDQLRAAGREQVIVVDQTAPEQEQLGFKTVCVIVPGLLPIDFGHEQRRVDDLPRLRTVPRIAGFRPTDLSLEELNPLPHPFP